MDLSIFTSNGKFLMLALDHRGSFKKLINPENPDSVAAEQAIALKSGIIQSLENQFSGLLIDVEFGLPAYQLKQKTMDVNPWMNALNKDRSKPFLLPLEKSGFKDVNGERLNELENTADELAALGASGAKILLYFDENKQTVNSQLATASEALSECRSVNLPLFLEIVVYDPDGDIKYNRPKFVLDSVQVLLDANIRPAVFKLEYPGSIDSCFEITKRVAPTPWILLTRGDTFNQFETELKDAVKAGCKGFLAGRALWQEVCQMKTLEKRLFLNETLPQRFQTISRIVLA